MTPNTTEADVTTFAHRGFAGVAPENTLAAARLASQVGADAIECDVVATGDGTPVVFHDRRLDDHGSSRGITDLTGAVADHTTATVTSARVLETAQRIPTLSDFVEAVSDDINLNVELKHPGTTTGGIDCDEEWGSSVDEWVPFVESVLDAIGRNSEAVLFSSFQQASLEAVQAVSPDARVAPIALELATVTRMADALDTEIIHPTIEEWRSVDRDLGNYTVNAWTARTWQDARDAVTFGVDGLIADYPNLLSTAPEWRISEFTDHGE